MLSPSLLVAAYRAGFFPMAMDDGEIQWFSPDPRGILPLDGLHVSRRLRRVVRSGRLIVTIDRAFRDVMLACAADRDEGTWIDQTIVEGYVAMHDAGLAHSVEVWDQSRLAGGLYGVALGGAFFGESMFHRVTDASKVALVTLVDRLRLRGFQLLDTQWLTPFLETLGGVDVPRDEYLERLQAALQVQTRFVD
jgi:leucyl/phenylalanyl-tRNA--protein transferase